MTELEWLEIFGNNLESMMQDAGYTQQNLADEINASQSSISKYLAKDVRNRQMPGIKTIINISYALDCDVSDLIDFDETIED